MRVSEEKIMKLYHRFPDNNVNKVQMKQSDHVGGAKHLMEVE